MSVADRAFSKIVGRELLILLLSLLCLTAILLIPAGRGAAVYGEGGGLRMIIDALRSGGDAQRRVISALFTESAYGALYTLSLTLAGTIVCVGLAVVVTIGGERSPLSRWCSPVLMGLSAVPSFLWWIGFVFVGSLMHPPVLFVDAMGIQSTPMRTVLFVTVAVFVVGVTNGSYLAAGQALEYEVRRIRREPFAIGARARGADGWRFYLRQLSVPALAVSLERIGGILGNCLVVELLMNIPGLSWRGKQVFGGASGRYFVMWGLIAIWCLLFTRGMNLVGRFAMIRLDPRIRRPAFGGSGQ
jgi:ABC-type dipeptide/oligopeptide/nickel transport system permease component